MTFTSLFRNPFVIFSKKREPALDLFKLFALLFVILDHSLQRWIDNSQTTQLYNFIFLFQMPAFMFASGYFALKRLYKMPDLTARSRIIYLAKRVIGLFIPFLSFALFKSIIINDYSYISYCILFPQRSLWFLWSLMWMEIIIFLSQVLSLVIKKNGFLSFALSIVFFLIFLSPFLILFLSKKPDLFDSKLICYYSFFFVFGYLFCFIIERFAFKEKVIANIIIALFSLVALILVMIIRPTIIFDEETPLNLLLRLIGSVGAVLVIYELCFLLSTNSIFCEISKMGRLSLEFYYIHRLLFLIPILNYYVNSIFAFIGLYLLVVVASFSLIILLKSFVITDFICFGKFNFINRTEQQKN